MQWEPVNREGGLPPGLMLHPDGTVSGSPGREGLHEFIEGHAPTVNEYRERYLSSGEDLVALANDYLNA